MSAGAIALREANQEDRDTLFAWRNDPWIVSLSESRRHVGRDEHNSWFSRTLANPEELLFIITEGEEDIGTVRVKLQEPDAATITIYLLEPFTGRGLGSSAVRAAGEAAFAVWTDLKVIIARIRADNGPSVSAFTKAGYARHKSASTEGELIEMGFRRETESPQ